MPNPAKDEIVSFDSAKGLRLWFSKHHAEKSELWIQVFKKVHRAFPGKAALIFR